MKKKTKLRFEDLPKNYEALCRLFLPRPLRAAADYAKVVAMTDVMAPRQEEVTGDQADYYELLCWLIEEYDAKRLKKPQFTPVDMLKRLMKERAMSPADLSEFLNGNRSLASAVLRGERKLSLRHVRILARRFGVSADNFL